MDGRVEDLPYDVLVVGAGSRSRVLPVPGLKERAIGFKHVEEAVFLGQRVIVLGSHPGRVVATASVDLPPERDLTVKRTPEFLALRSSIEDMVRTYHHA